MDRLDDLLLEWEERRERGETPDAAQLCPDDTGLRQLLASRIRLLEAYDTLMSPQAQSSSSALPRQIGKYEVLDTLGSGGMGVVYRAQDPVLRRIVAIKMIQPRHAALSGERAHARFAREGQTLARLDHPNIVRVFEAEVRTGSPYLVMEYIPGGSLACHRERLAAIGSRAILSLMEKVARAVHYAHAQGVLHRDLKPANILVGEDGEPRVADFGLAALLTQVDQESTERTNRDIGLYARTSDLTSEAAQPGTPAYKAPEQFDISFGKLGPATDVWAMGVILYELMTGQRPFQENIEASLASRVRGLAAPPHTRLKGQLAQVIDRCLKKDPEQRFQSALELAKALESLQGLSRRALLRRTMFAGGALLALGVPSGVLASDPYRRFQWQTRSLVQAVRAGRAVELIRPDGAIPNYYLRSGEGVTQIARDTEGLVVRSTAYSVLELLPELPEREIVVELEMRHDEANLKPNGDSSVGLFFAAAQVNHDGMTQHFHSYIFFDEFEDVPAMALAGKWRQSPLPGINVLTAHRAPFFSVNCTAFFDASSAPKPFRSLSLRISPNSTRMTWHGPPQLELGPLTHQQVMKFFELIDGKEVGAGTALAADYRPRLGLVVCGGKITIRKLQINSSES